MSDSKTSIILKESNDIYEKINQYNNTLVPALNTTLAAFGLQYPVTPEQIPADKKIQGQMLMALAEAFKAIASEIGSRNLEDNLLAAGYNSVEEAYADVPNLFAGDTARQVQTNIIKAGETVAVLDGLVDAEVLLVLWNKVLAIKSKVEEVAPLLDRR